MKKKTLGQVIAGLRDEKSMTMLQTALKCDLSEAVVWKLENDRPVRWETVHTIASVAFALKSTNPVYQTIHHLWLKQRNNKSESLPASSNKRNLSKHGVEASRKFRILIHELNPTQTRKVLAAAEEAARSL